MISALNIATSGLLASANQFQTAAQNVVSATTPISGNSTDITDIFPASSSGDTLASALVDTKTSAVAFDANAQVVKTADEMFGTLLDMFV